MAVCSPDLKRQLVLRAGLDAAFDRALEQHRIVGAVVLVARGRAGLQPRRWHGRPRGRGPEEGGFNLSFRARLVVAYADCQPEPVPMTDGMAGAFPIDIRDAIYNALQG